MPARRAGRASQGDHFARRVGERLEAHGALGLALSDVGRLTLAAPYAERLQTQIPTTKSRNDANATSS